MSLTIYEWLEDWDDTAAYDREEKLKEAVEEYNALYNKNYSEKVIYSYMAEARAKQWGEE